MCNTRQTSKVWMKEKKSDRAIRECKTSTVREIKVITYIPPLFWSVTRSDSGSQYKPHTNL